MFRTPASMPAVDPTANVDHVPVSAGVVRIVSTTSRRVLPGFNWWTAAILQFGVDGGQAAGTLRPAPPMHAVTSHEGVAAAATPLVSCRRNWRREFTAHLLFDTLKVIAVVARSFCILFATISESVLRTEYTHDSSEHANPAKLDVDRPRGRAARRLGARYLHYNPASSFGGSFARTRRPLLCSPPAEHPVARETI